VGREGERVRWGGRGGKEGRRGKREGEGRPPNVRDALTPLLVLIEDGGFYPKFYGNLDHRVMFMPNKENT